MDLADLAVAAGSIFAAYLIGAIPWGVVLARAVGGPDPRTLGSGRTGGANVLRVLGPRVAISAGVLDLLKGSIAVLIPLLLNADILVVAISALAAVIGHSRSVYIGFHGGRGVSPAFGALIVLQWPVGLLVSIAVLPVFFVIVIATRYSSLGSLIGSALAGVLLVVAIVIQGLPPAHLVYAIGGPALIWLFHADNIHRLLTGQERRVDRRAEKPIDSRA
jgi:acyl phosphate:glycerol-3-phosphate acyltransferase